MDIFTSSPDYIDTSGSIYYDGSRRHHRGSGTSGWIWAILIVVVIIVIGVIFYFYQKDKTKKFVASVVSQGPTVRPQVTNFINGISPGFRYGALRVHSMPFVITFTQALEMANASNWKLANYTDLEEAAAAGFVSCEPMYADDGNAYIVDPTGVCSNGKNPPVYIKNVSGAGGMTGSNIGIKGFYYY